MILKGLDTCAVSVVVDWLPDFTAAEDDRLEGEFYADVISGSLIRDPTRYTGGFNAVLDPPE